MNIIFYRYKSICEPDYIDAFKNMGLDVIEDKDGMGSGTTLEDKISHLGNLIMQHRPLFVFTINYFPFISLLCEKLHVFYVAVTVDCPVFEIFNTSIRSKFNRLFLFDKAQYEMVRAENSDGIFYLPLGGAVDRVSSLLGEVSDYKYDISFVGSLYNEKDPLNEKNVLSDRTGTKIDLAIKSQMDGKVYGCQELDANIGDDVVDEIKKSFEGFYPSDMSVHDISRYVAISDYISPHMTFKERVKILNLISEKCIMPVHFFTNSKTLELSDKIAVHKGVNSLKEMPFVFRQSRINLNITTRSIQSGLPQRVWDVLSCRGFLITNYQPEIDELFEDGEHLVTYKSYDELVEKVNYYLTHTNEREAIAQNGYEFVNKKGKVTDRTVEMIRLSIGG